MNFNWQFVVSKLFSIFFWCFQCFQPGSLSQATTFSTSPEMMGMSLKQTGDDQWMIERVEHIQFHFLNLWFGYSFWCIFFSTSDFFAAVDLRWSVIASTRIATAPWNWKKHMVFIHVYTLRSNVAGTPPDENRNWGLFPWGKSSNSMGRVFRQAATCDDLSNNPSLVGGLVAIFYCPINIGLLI